MSSTEIASATGSARPEPASSHLDQPLISVVVPTYNRAHVLPRLFYCLAHQSYPASCVELIVVDNSSSDDTEEVVARWARILPFPVSFYRKDNHGPAASRNYGSARARGEAIVFTDSDCMPSPDWLRVGARELARGAGIVCGPFLPWPREGEEVIVMQQSPITSDRGCYPTANLFVRADAFRAVGGFDERFGLYPWGELIAGEDADLAWRIRRTGVRVSFAPDAVVGHLSTPTSLWRILLRPVVVQIIPALLPRIPELRDLYLWHRYFNGPADLYLYLAWIGLLIAALTHNLIPALAVLPWVWHWLRVLLACRRTEGWAKSIGRSVIFAYLQVGTTVVLLFASVRYRRLVL